MVFVFGSFVLNGNPTVKQQGGPGPGGGGQPQPPAGGGGGDDKKDKPKEKKPSSKVIDLVAVLQQSLAQSQGAKKKPAAKSKGKRATKTHKKAA